MRGGGGGGGQREREVLPLRAAQKGMVFYLSVLMRICPKQGIVRPLFSEA